MVSLYDLTVEYRHNPIGTDEVQPRFSWKLRSDLQGACQKAYRVVLRGGNTLWDTGRVESNQSILVEYLGPALTARTVYRWEVTVWTNSEDTATESAFFETGLLSGDVFEKYAAWITHGLPKEEAVSPIFVRRFSSAKPIARARLYTSALGIYEAELNGEKVDDTYFAPGWTSYRKRLQYQTYPLKVTPGENELRVTLGNGWYKGPLGFVPEMDVYGDTTALLAMIVLTYEDGTEEIIGTDKSWDVFVGPIRFSTLYDGETQDTTLPVVYVGKAKVYDYTYQTLIAQENEPVRCIMRLPVMKKLVTPKGEQVYDFGQNLTGWVEIAIQGKCGQTLTLRHAESLDEKGNFYTGNLSFAKATDTYILNGEKQLLRPHFTFHGFRYVALEGLEEGQPITLTACHLTTDLKQTGNFACSDPRVNRLWQNILWGQRDNYLDVPTDCPQRSERLGWTGDATAFTPTAAFNSNIYPFMRKWLRDLAADQNPTIGMAQVVPDVLNKGPEETGQAGAAYWGDAATVVPWTLYEVYGDRRVLSEQYDSMKMWVDFIARQCGENGLWQTGFQYGDWLGLDTESNGLADERKGATDDYFVANACYLWSLKILSDSAALLGQNEDESDYRQKYRQVLESFREEYVTKTGRLVSETQTALTLALQLGLVEEKHKSAIAQRLAQNIKAHKTHLTTGFVGTPYLCLVLSDNGYHDLAGKLLLQEENPGWLYEVKMGATTVWERWNSILPDGSFNPVNMNSLNHYAYGSIGNWIYTRLCGLRPIEPGYQRFAVAPQFIKGITWAELSYESVYGAIKVAYRCEKGQITVDIEVPVNTTAMLTLPEKEGYQELNSGKYHFCYETETRLEQGRYSLETPLGVMLQHPAAKPMIAQYMPQMLDNPMLEYVINEPISTLLGYAPEAEPLYAMILQAMNDAETGK